MSLDTVFNHSNESVLSLVLYGFEIPVALSDSAPKTSVLRTKNKVVTVRANMLNMCF